ncbi:hypothetical protein D3C73_1489070 [compost metagenome]
MRESNVELVEYTVNRLINHIIKRLGTMIKRRNRRHNYRAYFRRLGHQSQMPQM